ncbi:unnamed protein product [Rhizophagus irregularis]|nr:unnamed protein product [Rhizophagus irregularis]
MLMFSNNRSLALSLSIVIPSLTPKYLFRSTTELTLLQAFLSEDIFNNERINNIISRVIIQICSSIITD